MVWGVGPCLAPDPDHLCVEVERRPELPLLQLLLNRAELLRGRHAVKLKDGPCAINGHNLKQAGLDEERTDGPFGFADNSHNTTCTPGC